jgi:hypothetical protein
MGSFYARSFDFKEILESISHTFHLNRKFSGKLPELRKISIENIINCLKSNRLEENQIYKTGIKGLTHKKLNYPWVDSFVLCARNIWALKNPFEILLVGLFPSSHS